MKVSKSNKKRQLKVTDISLGIIKYDFKDINKDGKETPRSEKDKITGGWVSEWLEFLHKSRTDREMFSELTEKWIRSKVTEPTVPEDIRTEYKILIIEEEVS